MNNLRLLSHFRQDLPIQNQDQEERVSWSTGIAVDTESKRAFLSAVFTNEFGSSTMRIFQASTDKKVRLISR